ncbi:Protein SET domain group 40 [Vitis vinifera]|uniref:Protein SET domain group 40 n=1 Tax=Vitis vinifera TaxID=29760 RepID=A0A438C968_VITVI|nr:Protein SET domain group 40 [Vitis vinifera]
MSKGKSSWWHPYLMQLPRSYDTLANFSQFEKQALQVDDAIWVTERAILKAELEWKKAIPLMEELKLKPQLQNFRAWLWASSTSVIWFIETRSF